MQNVLGPTLVTIATEFGQFLNKIGYKSTCMAHTMEMFGPNRGFSGMADSVEPCKMFWGPTLVTMATEFGQFLNKIAYKSTCMAHTTDLFGSKRGFSGMADGTMQDVVGPTLVAMEIWARRGDPVT